MGGEGDGIPRRGGFQGHGLAPCIDSVQHVTELIDSVQFPCGRCQQVGYKKCQEGEIEKKRNAEEIMYIVHGLVIKRTQNHREPRQQYCMWSRGQEVMADVDIQSGIIELVYRGKVAIKKSWSDDSLIL